MTLEETVKILDLLKAAYPQFYAKKSDAEMDSVMDLWATIFERDDVRIVTVAVRSFIESDEKGFPPVPGQVRAKIRLIVGRDELSEMEAWAMVAKAIRSASKDAAKSFECFPPVVQRIVHSPAQLRIWGQMESETVHSVIASNFMRSYKAIAAKEREYERLPADVKALVSGLKMVQKSLPD